jgi:isoamylase
MQDWPSIEGVPLPLGLTRVGPEGAYNFALYSRHATAVSLLLYGEQNVAEPARVVALDYLRNKSGRVWHCRLPASALAGCAYYAYRVDGPFDPARGHRFDKQKVLLDPYATSVFFPPGFDREAARRPGSNAGQAPLGLLEPDSGTFDWGDDRPPRHTSDLIIYEMHVRGFTMRPTSGVPLARQGTFAGVIDKIPYLKELGITAVELLPVYQYDPEEGGNYWGYMPLGFFTPHRAYAGAGGALGEFRAMVKALHAADIEVILDVVYNHTTERDEHGPAYNFRGIDNSTYYLLTSDLHTYRNDTGTGNVIRSAHPYVRKMIVDSLRYWVKEMHVDGFRFDLASIFSRNDDGTLNTEDPPIIAEISLDPDLAGVRLIAEPWDLGAYQLGRSFPGVSWFQWNGKFRDDVRAFVKGDSGTVSRLMTRLYGSDDLFPDSLDGAYHAYQSVNFVDCHDGFCLRDLVSYNVKHNEANGQHNTDGSNDNLSWNCGWEGDDHVPADVASLRHRQIKNFCCLLFLANGTPMFCAGDEFAHTQGGNNNPYNQDNETTWLDWSLVQGHADTLRFFRRMIAFRKAHPSLSRSRFWRGDVRWYGVGRDVDLSNDSHTLAVCLHGASQNDDDLYVLINAYWQDLPFTIQEGAAGQWKRVVDTSLLSPDDFDDAGPSLPSLVYVVRARSLVVLVKPRS